MKNVDVKFTPIRGFAVGLLHYNPRQESDIDSYDDEYHEQYTLMFLLFAIHFTIWEN